MLQKEIAGFLTSVFALTTVSSVFAAPIFPDVTASYPHALAIERLYGVGAISGNPDGKFYPRDPVNRAAMLKMLYVAAKREPKPLAGCFPDVQEKSWYEKYVCDAAASGIVQGYANDDGTRSFKPAKPVTRAEALKMTLAVFGTPEADLDARVQMYADVKAEEWFAKFVHTALHRNILPIPGQEELFNAHVLLERGEAAAYIWNALQASIIHPARSSSSSSSSSAPATSTGSNISAEQLRRMEGVARVLLQEQKALERAQANTMKVNVPFTERKTFDGKTPYSFEFTVNDAMVIDITATLEQWNTGRITCRLYHLGRSGFSQEYYLGFETEKTCFLRVAVAPGDWRLELIPSTLSPAFLVTGRVITGDGNDGFSQAKVLPIGQVRTELLDENDLEDWFTFTVPSTPENKEKGKLMSVNVVSDSKIGCLVYPLADVDQFGFTGPECFQKYSYLPGTYMIGIRQGTPLKVRRAYTIEIKSVK